MCACVSVCRFVRECVRVCARIVYIYISIYILIICLVSSHHGPQARVQNETRLQGNLWSRGSSESSKAGPYACRRHTEPPEGQHGIVNSPVRARTRDRQHNEGIKDDEGGLVRRRRATDKERGVLSS